MKSKKNLYGKLPVAICVVVFFCSNGHAQNFRALHFDGVHDFILVPHAPELDFEPPFTLEIWFKTNNNGSRTILD